jgi:energy-coupling factor transporter transmembrane protein EcfT
MSNLTLITFIIGLLGTIISFVTLIVFVFIKKEKIKSVAKALGGFVLLAFVSFLIQGFTNSPEGNISNENKEQSTIETQDNISNDESNNTNVTTIQRENIIGTSNKNYKDIDTSKPSSVRNDKTGNWRLSTVATTENIVEYTKSYYENNFSDDKEIHAIVNFTLNTTTKVSKVLDNILSVTVHEYVDKEEHDANELFSGMVLADYFVYLDNGDIEEIK